MIKDNIRVIIISTAVIVSAWLLAGAYIKKGKDKGMISVTGYGSKNFSSDLIVWNGSFSRSNMDMKVAADQFNNDREMIKSYLKDKGIPESQMVFNAVSITRDYDYGQVKTFKGFTLSQGLRVESSEVDKVENISREVTELINKGIEFTSEAPQYYYTKLADLKIDLIATATQDGKNRAERTAQNAGTSIYKLLDADMGVFQITGQNSGENVSWGGAFNTTSKNKTATITMKLKYSCY